ncbi:hypothetical protein [Streptosporangium sp. NPDC000509]|uniref:hypothetical protein n=1 Tax=Streptosporangium sp. NPDC000509 TaxID=3366186 RepID=UPI003686269A
MFGLGDPPVLGERRPERVRAPFASEHAQQVVGADLVGYQDLATEEDRRRERTRVIEIAQTSLSGGLTIRQAAENLKVETFTLKAWLKEAGIQISPATAAPVTAGGVGARERHPVSVLNELTQ